MGSQELKKPQLFHTKCGLVLVSLTIKFSPFSITDHLPQEIFQKQAARKVIQKIPKLQYYVSFQLSQNSAIIL